MGSISDGVKNQNIKQKQCCNKVYKEKKIVHIKCFVRFIYYFIFIFAALGLPCYTCFLAAEPGLLFLAGSWACSCGTQA